MNDERGIYQIGSQWYQTQFVVSTLTQQMLSKMAIALFVFSAIAVATPDFLLPLW
ncbi:MAG: hypothetical protein AAGF98_11410 [Cyanobacteria bacterium P01_H01_bin.153]